MKREGDFGAVPDTRQLFDLLQVTEGLAEKPRTPHGTLQFIGREILAAVPDYDMQTPGIYQRVWARAGRVDGLRGNHRHALWQMSLNERYTIADKQQEVSYHFRWDERATYISERKISTTDQYDASDLHGDLNRAFYLGAWAEFEPFEQSLARVSAEDCEQLMENLNEYGSIVRATARALRLRK